jgi:hypothetical protein
MRRPIIIAFTLLASVLVRVDSAAAEASAARDPWADWSVHARVELEWARGVGGDQKAEITALPEVEWKPRGAGWSLRAVGRIRADAFDRMEPGHPHPTELSSLSRRHDAGDHVDFELREFVLQVPVGDAHLKLGKQQTVWGRADGLKLLDVVNPQDFREFILDDFDESRIPLWTVNVEIPVGPVVAELVWIPDPSFDELPEAGSPYAFTSERLLGRPPAGLPIVVDEVDRPRRLARDSDAGLRLTGQLGDWDWSLAYLYHWDDRPLLPGRLELGPAGPQLRISPRYERTHLVGATTTGGFGDLTIRAEVAWRSDRFLPTGDPADADGVARTGELGYVLGFDWLGIRDTLLSLQVFQSWLLNDRAGLFRDTLDTNLTLLARREFLNERLRIETIWIHNLNDADGVLRPKVSYELRTGLTLWTGIDVFYGRSRGLFGQFDRADRWVVGLEWGI